MLLEVESNEMKLHQSECLSNYHKYTPLGPILYMQCEREVSLLNLSSLGLVTFTHSIQPTLIYTQCIQHHALSSFNHHPYQWVFHKLTEILIRYFQLLHILNSPRNGIIHFILFFKFTGVTLISKKSHRFQMSSSQFFKDELRLRNYFYSKSHTPLQYWEQIWYHWNSN